MNDDILWLTSDESTNWLNLTDQLLTSNTSELSILTRLRKSISVDQAREVLTLAKLRRKASKKFSCSNKMFFTDSGLQQSTGESIADFKANRFCESTATFDLCCGIGGDLISLAKLSNVVGIDKDPVCTEFANANLRANDHHAKVLNSEIQIFRIPDDAWVHIDPSRRDYINNQARRTVYLEFYQPPRSFLEELIERQPAVSIKLAPATEVPQEWLEDNELQWVGHENQCKQQILWTGKLVKFPGRRSVTVIDNNSQYHEFAGSDPSSYEVPSPAEFLEDYFIEPHATVRAAKLENDLAQNLGVKQLPTSPSFFTSEKPIKSPFVSCFEILHSTSKKNLAAELKELEPRDIEFKCRPPFDTLEKIKKSVPLVGSEVLTVIAFQMRERSNILICRRI